MAMDASDSSESLFCPDTSCKMFVLKVEDLGKVLEKRDCKSKWNLNDLWFGGYQISCVRRGNSHHLCLLCFFRKEK